RRLPLPHPGGGLGRPGDRARVPGRDGARDRGGALRPLQRRGSGRLRGRATAGVMAFAVATRGEGVVRPRRAPFRRAAPSKEGFHMRKTIASFVVAVCLVATPLAARADTQGNEMAFSALAAVSNIFYTPAKFAVAMVGFVAGGAAGTLNGGDTRAA